MRLNVIFSLSSFRVSMIELGAFSLYSVVLVISGLANEVSSLSSGGPVLLFLLPSCILANLSASQEKFLECSR